MGNKICIHSTVKTTFAEYNSSRITLLQDCAHRPIQLVQEYTVRSSFRFRLIDRPSGARDDVLPNSKALLALFVLASALCSISGKCEESNRGGTARQTV